MQRFKQPDFPLTGVWTYNKLDLLSIGASCPREHKRAYLRETGILVRQGVALRNGCDSQAQSIANEAAKDLNFEDFFAQIQIFRSVGPFDNAGIALSFLVAVRVYVVTPADNVAGR